MEQETREKRKKIRKEASRVGWGLTIYAIVFFAIVIIPFVAAGIYMLVNYPSLTEQDAMYIQIMEKCEASGLFYIIAVCLGTVFLSLFFRKSVTASSIMRVEKKMDAVSFLQVLCVFMGGQILFTVASQAMESGLNVIGYSAMDCIESASDMSTTLSMFLYASFIGPIAEELAYRGFVLRIFQKYGKMAAVLISALLFGIMHANIPQGIFAFGVGLVLGYVTVEYSIGWAIALHIINNFIFSDGLGWVLSVSGLSQQMQNNISTIIFAFFAIAAVIVLWVRRSTVKAFLTENKTSQKVYGYILLNGGMILFVAVKMFSAVGSLQKL